MGSCHCEAINFVPQPKLTPSINIAELTDNHKDVAFLESEKFLTAQEGRTVVLFPPG